MFDVDTDLAQLAGAPVPRRLETLEEVVLQSVAGHSFDAGRESYRTRVALVAAALAIGVVGGLMPEASPGAGQSYSPLTGVDELAPSTLLAGRR